MIEQNFCSLFKDELPALVERMVCAYEKNFTIHFTKCAKKIRINRFLADLLSPRIFELHYTDKSANEFYLIKNSGEIEFLIISRISQVMKLPTFENIQEFQRNCQNNLIDDISRNENKSDIKFLIILLKLFKELGNQKIMHSPITDHFRNKEMSKDLFEQLFDLEQLINSKEGNKDKEKNEFINFSVFNIADFGGVFKYIAHNFEENKEIIKNHLSYSEIKNIFECEDFQIKNENEMLKFIKEIVKQRGEAFKDLIQYIEFVNLGEEELKEYFEMIDPSEINGNIWKSIAEKIIKFVVDLNKTKSTTSEPEKINKFKGKKFEGKEFEGIFYEMNKKCDGNCSKNNLIEVTCSSPLNSNKDIIFEYSSISGQNVWGINCVSNGYIQIDFKNQKVNLTHYSIHFSNIYVRPKTWSVEGSNNLEKWDLLDSIINDTYLTNSTLFHCYKCSNSVNESYRYIRIYQRDISNPYFTLNGLEFFGELI